MQYFGHIIARLNGQELRDNVDAYCDLVRKGIAGFIIFGGMLEEVRRGVCKLQQAADLPLIISSDLEQGAGQQLTGGTLFPPAMALTNAFDLNDPKDITRIQELFAAYADEALYAGINMILAPVVDINTNPRNPIISVRAFGEDKKTVSLLSCLMVETVRSRGAVTCAKHFPGHGDTGIDSHLSLPVLKKKLNELEAVELYPFRRVVDSDVEAMMLGHISVPSIDPEGIPVSVSEKAVTYIREHLGFTGVLMTDALDMGGLSTIGQHTAAAMALNAGVDILLHPDDPVALNAYLKEKNVLSDTRRIETLRRSLHKGTDRVPDFKSNAERAQIVTERSITIQGDIERINPSSIVIIKEDEGSSAGLCEPYLRERFRGAHYFEVAHGVLPDLNAVHNALTVIFSTTGAWKGTLPQWFNTAINNVEERTQLFIVFGNPYVIHCINKPKILTYWCSEQAETAVIKILKNL